jgi:tRNA pseudouridine55 synthase
VAKPQSNLHGILVVDKPGLPPGADPEETGGLLTSHDVVQRVRRWSGQRRIGHTGTLDPMASGVLVLCLGAATRLVEYYQGHDKWYTAVVQLGVETNTYDAVGEIVRQEPVPTTLTEDGITVVLRQFEGTTAQKPPIYSALKQAGESLHRKARRGEKVEVDARPVTIHRLALLSYQPPAQITLAIHCSAGTYIRSLAHDLGEALGTCAHLRYLRRDAAGSFTTADAHSLAAVEAAAVRHEINDLLLSAGARLDLPLVVLSAENSERLGYGQKIWLPAPSLQATEGQMIGGVDEEGQLLGVLCVLQHGDDMLLCKAEKWLAPHLDESLH